MQLSWLKQNLNGAYQYCLLFNPHTPVAQKVADEVLFDVSKVKESSFVNRTSLNPHPHPTQIFDAYLFKKYQFKPFQLSFFNDFLYQDLVLSQIAS